jgi:hypothetical protein
MTKMASFSLKDIINADIIECELCKKRFYGMATFVGHPCRDDKLGEGKYLVRILLYLRLRHELKRRPNSNKYKSIIVNHDAQY